MRLLSTLLLAALAWLPARPLLAGPGTPTSEPSLEFIENRGQLPAPVRYAAALPGGGQLFAEADGLRLALLAPGTLAHALPTEGHPAPAPEPEAPVRGHAFDLRWVGASPTATLSARQLTAEHRNYLRGNDPAHWARDVRSYRELRYADLWPGIAARFYENDLQRLEYDLELAPGADPAAIGLRHDGAAATLDAAGNLLLATTVGAVQQLAPQAWQLDAHGGRQPVACRYQLGAQGVVGFALGSYDHRRPLVIDPVIVFASYTGSTANNWGFTATYDAAGNLYSGGIAFGVGYPVSPGAFQTTFGGIVDMALIKYNVTQTGPAARAWATYLGGSQADFPHSLVVNAQGELLVLGSTSSLNFPTTAGALQRTFGGGLSFSAIGNAFANGSDLVVCRLAANGGSLQASTYLGGSGNDGVVAASSGGLDYNYGDAFRGDILTDAAGDVYLASYTASLNFPLPTATSFQRIYGGGTSDAVVCKLSASLGAMLWGGYLGGSGADAAYSLQLSPTTGEVYVAGGTASANLPATGGALNPTARGNLDGFVARIAAGGGSILRSTYLGTGAYDQAFFLQLGTDGGVYVLGQTLGAYLTTPGLYTNANGRQFIHKLSADLSSTLLATVFGTGRSGVDISPTAFLVDQCNRVFVSGWGGSLAASGSNTSNLPITAGAFQAQTDGSDFYLAQFSAGLTGLGYATYYGGSALQEHVDGGTSRFDPRGVVYQAVCSCFAATGFPIPPGANYYATANGIPTTCNNAAFVFNFRPDVAEAGPPQTVCLANTLPLVGTPAGGVWSGPGVSGSQATGYVFTPPAVGTFTLTYSTTTGTCGSTATREVTVTPLPATPAISASLQPTYCQVRGAALPLVPLVGTPAGGTFSGLGVVAATGGGQAFNPNIVGPSVTITYTYGASTTCPVQATRQVTIYSITAGPDRTVCANGPAFSLQPQYGYNVAGVWSGPGVSGSAATGFVFTPSAALAGVNTITYTIPGASCSDTQRITVLGPPTIVLTPLPTGLCRTDQTRYPLTATPAGGIWQGTGVALGAGGYYFTPSGTGSVPGTFTLTYYAFVQSGGLNCTYSQSMTVAVGAPPTVVLPADTLLCPNTRPTFALRGTPAGGVWTGAGVSGSTTTGFFFTPPAGWGGSATLTYTAGAAGCTSSATRRVGTALAPAWQPGGAPANCPGDQQRPLAVQFADASGNAATRWDFGDGSAPQTGALVLHTYQQVGRYQPRASLPYNSGRCELTAQLAAIEVLDVPIPNVITPNGDALNQTFRLPPTGCQPRLKLFSRWGRLVYEAAAYRDDWDATGNPGGLYFYLLSYPDGHTVKGWLEVVK